MLTLKTLVIKNFMSIGEMPQTVNFNSNDLILVLGENLDSVSDNGQIGRNGAGKSAIFNALSYAMYGQALTNIKRDNLINNVNNKGMLVILEFEKDGHKYRIERGRKPNIFRFIVDEHKREIDEDSDESQGESKHTQQEIEKVLGFSHVLFKNIIALNTSTTPFLNMSNKEQREFIEELLGILQLSEKSEKLKELMRLTKEEIKQEEFKISTIKESNEKISQTIQNLEIKSTKWEQSQVQRIKQLKESISELNDLDISEELNKHQILESWNLLAEEISKLQRESRNLDAQNAQLESLKKKIEKSLEKAEAGSCPTCGQEISEEHEHVGKDLVEQLAEYTVNISENSKQIGELSENIDVLISERSTICGDERPSTFYRNTKEAYEHKTSLQLLQQELNDAVAQVNPFVEQIVSIKETGIQEVDYDSLNLLSRLLEHQDFLYKMLTNKDSPVRKKIIDQNLAYLNHRLTHYLEKLGLPHVVKFMNDLSVVITFLGRELDFDNLSRGEKNRLILALSWGFRDIFELLNHNINIMLIDELLDNGSDSQLVDGAMSIIRNMHQDRSKDIMVVSHREELVAKISNILLITKEGGFTTLSFDNELTN